MRERLSLAVALGICLLAGFAAGQPLKAQGPVPPELAGADPTYGYNPYKHFYGPIYAQRELDTLTYQPGVRGLDYGYGLGYFLGFGPPKQYRCLPPTHQTKAPARGCIDARWDSGYALRSGKHHQCGYFAVCHGCSGLIPTQYHSFADTVVPAPTEPRSGFSWYTAESWYSGASVPAAASLPAATPVPAAHGAPADAE